MTLTLNLLAQDGGPAGLSGLQAKIDGFQAWLMAISLSVLGVVFVGGILLLLVTNLFDIPPPKVLTKPAKSAMAAAVMIGASAGALAWAMSFGQSLF